MQRYECQDVQAVLSGLLDGELDATTSHLAEAHLSQCAPCRTLLQQAEETDDLLRATVGSYAAWPSDLDRRIRTEVFGQAEDAAHARGRRRLLFAAWSGWSIAAVVMLGFGLALSQGWLGGSTQPGGSVAVNEIAAPSSPRQWVPPVGSEMASTTAFDRQQRDVPAVGEIAAAPEPPEVGGTVEAHPGGEALAMAPAAESEPAESARQRPQTPSFSQAALAGVEAEMEAAGWLQALAANLPSRAVEAPEPAPIAAEQPEETLAVASMPVGNPATGEVLHQASVLLTVLEQAGDESFGDVRLVQQALSSDDVLERLAVARNDLQSPDSVDLVNRAWSMLEWTNGSVDQEELERVKRSIAMQDLPRRLERLSDEYWN